MESRRGFLAACAAFPVTAMIASRVPLMESHYRVSTVGVSPVIDIRTYCDNTVRCWVGGEELQGIREESGYVTFKDTQGQFMNGCCVRRDGPGQITLDWFQLCEPA